MSSPDDKDCSKNDGSNVFIVGLQPLTREKDLLEICQKYGKVESCHLIIDPRTEMSRGFAFVKMVNKDDASKLIQFLNGTRIDGALVSLRLSRRGGSRPPTPGHYLGTTNRRNSHEPYHTTPPPPPRRWEPYRDSPYYRPPPPPIYERERSDPRDRYDEYYYRGRGDPYYEPSYYEPSYYEGYRKSHHPYEEYRRDNYGSPGGGYYYSERHGPPSRREGGYPRDEFPVSKHTSSSHMTYSRPYYDYHHRSHQSINHSDSASHNESDYKLV